MLEFFILCKNTVLDTYLGRCAVSLQDLGLGNVHCYYVPMTLADIRLNTRSTVCLLMLWYMCSVLLGDIGYLLG
ncbi:hypothetical protein FKM82_026269 [Ascaphus truei]